MGIETRDTPKVASQIKKQIIYASSLLVFLIFMLAIANALYQREDNNTKKEVKKEQQHENLTSEELPITDQYFIKTEKKPVKQETAITEQPVSNNVIVDNGNYNGFDERAELLRAYYTKLIQDEEQARTSNLEFARNTSTNETISTNVRSAENYQGAGQYISPSMTSNEYMAQNMQKEKKDFIENSKTGNFYNPFTEANPISPYEVMAGTMIPAILATGINSDLPSESVAVVREDVYDTVTGNVLLIPKGTRVIGEYDSGISYGQDRLLIVWKRLIFPNGKYIGLSNMNGVDLSGYAGFSGKVNNHFFDLLKAVVLSSAMGAGGAIVTDNGEDDWRTEAGRGAGEVILNFGNKMGDRILNRQPTIEIPQGYRFNITVRSDIVLSPYKK